MRLLLRLVQSTVARDLLPVHRVKAPKLVVLTATRNYSSSNWGSKKKHRKVPVYTFRADRMADPNIEKQLEPLRMAVKEQVGCN